MFIKNLFGILIYNLLAPLAAAAQAAIKGPCCGPGIRAVPQTIAATPHAIRLLPVEA